MRRPILLLVTLTACLSAGEAALGLQVPDQQRLQRRLAEGPLGALLGHQALRSWVASTAGGGAADLRATLSGAAQLRIVLDRLGRPGGVPSGRLALGAIADLDPADQTMPAGLHAQRAGAWVLVGGLDGRLLRPEATSVAGQWSGADMLVSVNLPAWASLLPPGQRTALGRVLQGWKLGQVHMQVDLATRREQSLLPGAVPPMKPIDRAALVGLPDQADLVLAAGLSGEALASAAGDILHLAGLEVEESDAWSERQLGAPVADLLTACGGTVWLAVVGQPRQIMASLPQHPTLVAALHHWILAAQPEAGEAAETVATGLVAAAREQATPLAWPGGVGFVRLAHGRFYLATDARLLDGLSVDEQPGSEVVNGAEWGTGACVRVQWQPHAWAMLPPGTMTTSSSPWDRLMNIVAEIGVPAGWAEAKLDASGLRVDSDGPLAMCAAAISVMPGLLPDWCASYTQRCAAQHQATMRLLIQRARDFAGVTSNQWPRDLADLQNWARDLAPEQFAAAGWPELATPFIYVQPVAGAPLDQPVLVQDPVMQAGRGSLVGFADGRVEFRSGALHWTEAQRLAALPEAREHGVLFSAWATAPRTF
jgi:hypothetical protein